MSASPSGETAVKAALAALRAVPAFLPELAEIVPLVRVCPDSRVQTAGVFASGRMVVNPEWFNSLLSGEALFVAAHELLHLSLRTHERGGRMDPRAVNVAHDLIINDMLREALSRDIPAGGLDMPGARNLSLEELSPTVAQGMGTGLMDRSFQSARPRGTSALGAALGKAGLLPSGAPPGEPFDVLDSGTERDWFPGEPVGAIDLAETRVREAALRAVSLGELRRGVAKAFGRGEDSGGAETRIEALRTAYRPPWHEALQTWMEAVAPGERTYVRASRRGADRTDVVLPGRRREGWTLHLILDTSGSMVEELRGILGTIASFCESVNVANVRILQCDVEVTRDEMVEVASLASFAVAGFGGSDMSPAMWRLAQDPEVESAIVITDGYIAYPEAPMPYAVLWATTTPHFRPLYGHVVPIERPGGMK